MSIIKIKSHVSVNFRNIYSKKLNQVTITDVYAVILVNNIGYI